MLRQAKDFLSNKFLYFFCFSSSYNRDAFKGLRQFKVQSSDAPVKVGKVL
jgi:hypothetical protein